MKSYKQFISEMPAVNPIRGKPAYLSARHHSVYGRTEKVGSFGNYHIRQKTRFNKDIDDYPTTEYYACDRNNGRVHMRVRGVNPNPDNPNEFHINNLHSTPPLTRPNLEGAKFYEALRDHGVKVHSDTEHTKGSDQLWNKIRGNKKNKVTSYNVRTGEHSPDASDAVRSGAHQFVLHPK